jgi:hypothetical protein
MVDAVMACEENERLLAEYKMTTQKFADAVTELHRKIRNVTTARLSTPSACGRLGTP